MFAYKLNVRGADIILQNLGQHKISDSNLQYSPKLNTGCYRLMLEFSFLIDHFIFNDIVLETTWGFLTVYDLMTAGKKYLQLDRESNSGLWIMSPTRSQCGHRDRLV